MKNSPGFWTDELVKETPDFGELDTSPGLLGISMPRYRGGYRIIAECEEFRVLQKGTPEGNLIVERNLAIQRAFLKSKMKINGDAAKNEGRWIRRIAIADALNRLIEFSSDNRDALEAIADSASLTNEEIGRVMRNSGSPGATLTKLAGTIGLEAANILGSSDPRLAISELTSAFQLGLNAVARSNSLIDDKRTGSRPRAHDLIEKAEFFFLHYRVRPTKSLVRSLVTFDGQRRVGGKNAPAAWKDLFTVSGLTGLPE